MDLNLTNAVITRSAVRLICPRVGKRGCAVPQCITHSTEVNACQAYTFTCQLSARDKLCPHSMIREECFFVPHIVHTWPRGRDIAEPPPEHTMRDSTRIAERRGEADARAEKERQRKTCETSVPMWRAVENPYDRSSTERSQFDTGNGSARPPSPEARQQAERRNQT